MLTESDRAVLKQAFNVWPERLTSYGHPETEPAFTQRLEESGANIREHIKAGELDATQLREFLVDVGVWKMPRQRQQHAALVARNDDATIQNVFRRLAETGQDLERISTCTELIGFGRQTGQTRMASAILRFIWPRDYGVIDWRNWAVLSNCGHRFLSEALLPMLAETPSLLKDALFDCDKYLSYLEVLRQLRPILDLDQTSDVDLAVYSYSIAVWPFAQIWNTLTERLDRRQHSQRTPLGLREIYETYWEEWEKLGNLPVDRQRDEKLDFLWMCLEITPRNITVWDQVTKMKVSYFVKHKRDLDELSRKIGGWPAHKAVDELDRFMWMMRMKGDGYGVLS